MLDQKEHKEDLFIKLGDCVLFQLFVLLHINLDAYRIELVILSFAKSFRIIEIAIVQLFN